MTPYSSPATLQRPTTQALSALALAIAALSPLAHAATPTEEELKNTKLYGNVSIAQDSTSDWGPWTSFEPPASGNTPPINIPAVQPDLYRPLAQAPSTPAPLGLSCAGGSICGFGIFFNQPSNDMASVGNDSVRAQPAQPDRHAYIMTGDVLSGPAAPVVKTPVNNENVATADALTTGNIIGDNLPQSIGLNFQPLATGTISPLLAPTGELTFTGSEGGSFYGSINYSGGVESTAQTPDGYRIYAYSDVYDSEENTLAATQVTDVSGGAALTTYIQGNGVNTFGGSRTTSQQSFQGVWGLTTPDADMAALRASGATASYTGSASNGIYGDVTMKVNFGNSTFSEGSFNGGQDVSVYVSRTVSGGTQLTGQVGFDFAGTITGVNINATSITAKDGTIGAGSFVQGAFFGPNANAVAGVANIIKTSTPVPVSPTNLQAAETVRPAYTNATATGAFIVVRPEFAESNK